MYVCMYVIMIREVMRSGDLNRESLINQMTSVDNFVIDNSPIIDKYLKMHGAKMS